MLHAQKLQEVQLTNGEMLELKTTIEQEQHAYENMQTEQSDKMSAEQEALEQEVARLQTEQAKFESERDGKDAGQKELKIKLERKQKVIEKVICVPLRDRGEVISSGGPSLKSGYSRVAVGCIAYIRLCKNSRYCRNEL